MEKYQVADTEIIIQSNTVAIINGEKIRGTDRLDLLANIGNYLKEKLEYPFSFIMDFYSVVRLR